MPFRICKLRLVLGISFKYYHGVVWYGLFTIFILSGMVMALYILFLRIRFIWKILFRSYFLIASRYYFRAPYVTVAQSILDISISRGSLSVTVRVIRDPNFFPPTPAEHRSHCRSPTLCHSLSVCYTETSFIGKTHFIVSVCIFGIWALNHPYFTTNVICHLFNGGP